MATALLGGSVFGWLIAGAALIYAFSAMGGGVDMNQPKFDQFSDPGVGGGPWQASTTSQTVIPLIFGTVRVPLPIVHYRLDGNQFHNMWIVAAIGEDWGSLTPGGDTVYENELTQLWVNDYEINNLTDYTEEEELKDKNHSWFKVFPNGLGAGFEWDSTGNHAFVKEAEVDAPAESYSLICTHDADQGAGPVHATVRLIHQWEVGGAQQDWIVKIEYLETVPGDQVYILENRSHFYDETQTVSAGKDSETYHVAGTRESTVEFDLPYKGKFKVILESLSGQVDTSDPLYGTDPPVKPDYDDPIYNHTREQYETEQGPRYRRVNDPAYDADMAVWKIDIVEWAKANPHLVDSYLAGLEDEGIWGTTFFTERLIGEYALSKNNPGKLYLDSVELVDPGQAVESVNSYGTSLVLIRIIDNTGELMRPQLTGLVTGGPSNPVDALEWVLTNRELGMGLPIEHIDKGSFFEVKGEMDALGYEFNRAYCAKTMYENALNEICLSGRLLLADWNGLITLFLDEEELPENLTIVDLDNEADEASVGYGQKSLREIPNKFSIQYVDSNCEYGLQEVITENVDLQQKAGVINEMNIAMVGVTTMAKAWDLGWYQLQYAMSDMFLQFEPFPMHWTLRPGKPFVTISEKDPLINNKEWIVLTVDESKAGQYKVKAGKYMRDAYTPPALNEWATDIWIPGATPAEGQTGSITPAKMNITASVTENTSAGHVDVHFIVTNIPDKTKKILVFRSYNPWLEETGDLSSYESVGQIITRHGSHYDTSANYMTVEIQRYTPIRYRFIIVDKHNWEADMAGSPMVTVYPFVTTEGFPGYGAGEYGIIPYGG